MRRIVTNEEKAAIQIIKAVDNSQLWIPLVGVYLFELSPPELFDRLETATLEALKEREKEIARQQLPPRKLIPEREDPPF